MTALKMLINYNKILNFNHQVYISIPIFNKPNILLNWNNVGTEQGFGVGEGGGHENPN